MHLPSWPLTITKTRKTNLKSQQMDRMMLTSFKKVSFINGLNAKLSISHGVSFWVWTSWAIFIFPYVCKYRGERQRSGCKEGGKEWRWKKVKGQNAENNKLERKRGGEKDRGRQRDWQEWMSWGGRDWEGIRWTDTTAGGGREGERGSSVHAPLPMQRGLFPGGTRTLSPCPALYSPGYCSQINLASYPV